MKTDRIVKFKAKSSKYPEQGWMYWSVKGMPPTDIIEGTLCQSVGLIDKERNDIYERDILKLRDEEFFVEARWLFGEMKYGGYRNGWNITNGANYKIVGNTIDNPNLIKE